MPKSVLRPDCPGPFCVCYWSEPLRQTGNGTSDMHLLRRSYVGEGQRPFPESQRLRLLLQPRRWNGGTQPQLSCGPRAESGADAGDIGKRSCSGRRPARRDKSALIPSPRSLPETVRLAKYGAPARLISAPTYPALRGGYLNSCRKTFDCVTRFPRKRRII